MRPNLLISLIPFLLTLFAATAFAIPVNGYRAREFIARDGHGALSDGLILRGAETQIYRRGNAWQTVKKILTYKPTEEEKEYRKAFAQGRKIHQMLGDEHAKKAKKDLKAAGEEYNVKAQFHGPGYVEHGEKAIKATQREWHHNKSLQQYRHADVSVSVLPSGRKHVTAKYHNGESPREHRSPTFQFTYD